MRIVLPVISSPYEKCVHQMAIGDVGCDVIDEVALRRPLTTRTLTREGLTFVLLVDMVEIVIEIDKMIAFVVVFACIAAVGVPAQNDLWR
jgi:hypothetical protein